MNCIQKKKSMWIPSGFFNRDDPTCRRTPQKGRFDSSSGRRTPPPHQSGPHKVVNEGGRGSGPWAADGAEVCGCLRVAFFEEEEGAPYIQKWPPKAPRKG